MTVTVTPARNFTITPTAPNSYKLFVGKTPEGTLAAIAENATDIASNAAAIAAEIVARIAGDQGLDSDITAVNARIDQLILAESPGAAELTDLRAIGQAASAEATAYTAIAKSLDDVINATRWGMAPGNSAADNRTAWDAMLASGAGVIVIPPGTYNMDASTTAPTLSGGDVTILGFGATIKGYSGSDKYLLAITGSNVNVAGITFDSNSLASVGGIVTSEAVNVTIVDCEFMNAPSNTSSLSINGNSDSGGTWSDGVRAINCTFHDAASRAIGIIDTLNTWIHRCKFYDNGGTAPNCDIDVEPNSGQSVKRLWITECYFTNSTGPAIIVQRGNSSIDTEYVWVQNNVIITPGTYAIGVTGTNYVTVSGNKIVSPGNVQAIGVGTPVCDDVQIFDNYIYNTSNGTSLGAINVGSANGLLVHGNTIDTTTGYGINADSCTGLIRIYNNTIHAARRGINLRDNADDGFTVADNTIRDCTGPGIYLFSTGNISPIVTGNHLKNNNTGTEENAQLYWAGNTTQGRCTNNTVWDDPGGTTYSINIAGTGVWFDGNDCYGGAVNISGTGNTTGTNRT